MTPGADRNAAAEDGVVLAPDGPDDAAGSVNGAELVVRRGHGPQEAVEALNALDSRLQRQIIESVLARAKGRDGTRFGVIWSPMNVGISELFDRVLVFENGVLVADGKPSELAKESGAYADLIGA